MSSEFLLYGSTGFVGDAVARLADFVLECEGVTREDLD